MILYLIGVVIALVMGLCAVIQDNTVECNTSNKDCVYLAIALSAFSWLIVLIYISVIIKDKYIDK